MEKEDVCRHCGRIINSACCFLGLFALHQQRTLLSHVRQSIVTDAERYWRWQTDYDATNASSKPPTGYVRGPIPLRETLDFIVRGHLSVHENSYSKKSRWNIWSEDTILCSPGSNKSITTVEGHKVMNIFLNRLNANRFQHHKYRARDHLAWPHSFSVNPIKIMRPPRGVVKWRRNINR